MPPVEQPEAVSKSTKLAYRTPDVVGFMIVISMCM
jgi:hypothetical protein